MNETMRKRWWRAVLAVGVGGGAATGTWLGFARTSGADSMPPLAQAEVPTPWVRATAPEPIPFQSPSTAQPLAPAPEAGVTNTVFHEPPLAGEGTAQALPKVPEVAPVLPPLPVTALKPVGGAADTADALAIPPLPLVVPAVATGTVASMAEGVTPAGSTAPPLPALPDLPTPGLPGVPPTASLPLPPAVPALPTPVPVTPATPITPEASGAPAASAVPVAPPSTPIEVPAPAPLTIPTEKPQPEKPEASPLTEVAPTPQPVKITSPELPVMPLKADSRLPDESMGNTLKQDQLNKPDTTTIPGIGVPAFPATPILPQKPLADAGTPGVPPASPTSPVEPPVARPIVPPDLGVGKVEDVVGVTKPLSKPIEPILPAPAKNEFPNIIAKPDTTELTSGDGKMTALTRTAAAAVIGGMMVAPVTPNIAIAAPAAPITPILPSAVAPVVPIQADNPVDSAELKKQLEESNNKLSTIQDQLKQLTELLNGKKDEKGFPLPSDPGVVAEMKQLRDRLSQIEKDLANVKSQTSLRPSTGGTGSTSPIPGATVVDPKTGKGTVRVVNEYPVQISIVVNGTSYRIAPSKSLDVDVAAGDFTYQLLESGAAATKSVIKEKETVTLRIK